MNSKWPDLLILWVWRMTGCRVLRPLSVPPLDLSEGNTVSSMYQDEGKYRRMLWEEEEKKIDEHNAEYGQDQTGIYASLNEFSDMVTELWIVNSMFLLYTSFKYWLVFNVLFAFS